MGAGQFDAACYNALFERISPGTLFVSAGGSSQIEQGHDMVAAMHAVARGVNVIRLIDRDEMSALERDDKVSSGLKVLRRRELENYLFDFRVITTFLEKHDKLECVESIYEQHEDLFGDENFGINDVKAQMGLVFETIKNETGIPTWGRNRKEFAKHFLVPALIEKSEVFEELRGDIFD